MEYKANLKLDLKELEVVRTLLDIEIKNNKLRIDDLNELDYNVLLKKLLKKIQIGEVNILEDSLEDFLVE